MPDFPDQVRILQNQTPIITLTAGNGILSAGGHGEDGGVLLSDKAGAIRAGLSGVQGALVLREPPSAPGGFNIGQEAVLATAEGSRLLLDVGGKHRIRLEGKDGNIWVGGNGTNGDLVLFAAGGDNSTPGKATVVLNGATGNIRAGGPGVNGNVALFRADVTEANAGDFSKATIHLNGQTGDIILANADCAEEFDIAETEEVQPGTVMVLDQAGKLRQSRQAYDKKVAGVLSGAGDLKPGIVLDRKQSPDAPNRRMPLAVVGKVYCQADAQYSAIEVGDLLASSPTPGHAMKATDPRRAFGSVIGKALRPLDTGQGLIPILIALQ